jgi:hypothetical protein
MTHSTTTRAWHGSHFCVFLGLRCILAQEPFSSYSSCKIRPTETLVVPIVRTLLSTVGRANLRSSLR